MSSPAVSRRLFLRVRELLESEQSQTSIANLLALPLATIAGIAAGRIQPSRLIIEHDDPQRDAMSRAERCPGCGGMVYLWPCLACQLACQAGTCSEPLPVPSPQRAAA